jgi:hypothetical protein
MKSFMRMMGIFSLLLVVTLSPVLTAAAQNGQGVNCRGLSEEDCQILLDSADKMTGLQSISVSSWSADMTVVAPEESVTLSGSGSARAMLPPSVVAMMSDMPAVGTGDVAALQALLSQFNSTMIQQMISEALLQFVLTDFTLDSPEESMSLTNASLVLKDGVFYLQAPSPNGSSAWFGQPIELSATDLEELDSALAEMQTNLSSEDFAQSLEIQPELMQFQQDLMAVVNEHITTVRGADEALNGQSMAAFTTTFDLAGLLADPALVDVIIQFADAQAAQTGESMDLTSGQLTLVFTMLQMVLGDSQIFTFQQWVGLDDLYLHKVQLDISVDADLSTFEADAGSVSFALSLSAEMDEFNAVTPESVEVPAEYHSMDASFLFGTAADLEATIEQGQTVSADLPGGEQLLYGIILPAGQDITFTLESDDGVYPQVYGPDGFQVDVNDVADPPSTFTFTTEQDGMYMIQINGWGSFDLTVQ